MPHLTTAQVDQYALYIAFGGFVVAVALTGFAFLAIEHIHTRRNR